MVQATSEFGYVLPPDSNSSPRMHALCRWLHETSLKPVKRLEQIAGDASFRRYFRAYFDQGTAIVMDAPPEKESTAPFVAVGTRLREVKWQIPEFIAHDVAQGFMLLSDFGDLSYLSQLTPTTADVLYGEATGRLIELHRLGNVDTWHLPHYEAAMLMRELRLFDTWYLGQHLGLEGAEIDQVLLKSVYAALIESALSQPQVCVHRDFHSRNLMVLPDGKMGVLDFQDAVVGPVTYDLVSLLKDCYIAWPVSQVNAWALDFYTESLGAGTLSEVGSECFQRWFDWMGLQRHLKVLGIFARLSHRDGKPQYMDDVPRIVSYIEDVCGRYPEFEAFSNYFRAVCVRRESRDESNDIGSRPR